MNHDYDLTDPAICYFVGSASVPANTVIGQLHNNIAVGLLVDTRTLRILDVFVSLISQLGQDFVRAQIIGRQVTKEDIELTVKLLERYQGPAQKAVVVALRGAYERYISYIHKIS